MQDRSPLSREPRPAAADVVTGPVGSARLVEPSDIPHVSDALQELPGAAMPIPVPDQDGDDPPGGHEALPVAANEKAKA